jgi:hypothetical protein
MTERRETPMTDSPTEETYDRPDPLWLRIVWMVILAALTSLATTLLIVAAILQVIAKLVDNGQPNDRLRVFGEGLARWFAKTARFQTFATEEKPFPWSGW